MAGACEKVASDSILAGNPNILDYLHLISLNMVEI